MTNKRAALAPPKTPAQCWIELQISLGESAEMLARRIGTSAESVSRYRSGQRALGRDDLVAVQKLSGLPLDALAMVPGSARRRRGGRSVARTLTEMPVSTVSQREYVEALAAQNEAAAGPQDPPSLSPAYELTVDRIRIAMALNLNPGRQWAQFCELCAADIARSPESLDDYWLDWCQAIREHLGNAKDGSAPAPAPETPPAPTEGLYAHLDTNPQRGPDRRSPQPLQLRAGSLQKLPLPDLRVQSQPMPTGSATLKTDPRLTLMPTVPRTRE